MHVVLYLFYAAVIFVAGLEVFEFEYDFTSTRLVFWEARVLQLAGIWNPPSPVQTRASSMKSKGEKQYSNSPQEYGERISPPPSNFLLEDAVVSPALHNYSALRKSRTDLTDEQLIENEVKEGCCFRHKKDCNVSVVHIDYQQLEEEKPLKPQWKPRMPTVRPLTSDFSYNAMLQSYARKVDRPMFTGNGELIEEDGSYENIETSDVKENNLQLAQDMNFEVVTADDYISPGTRSVRINTEVLRRINIATRCDNYNVFTLA